MTTPFISTEEFEALVPELDTSGYTSTTISGMLAQATKLVENYLDYSLAFEAGKTEKVRGIIDNHGDIIIYPSKLPLRALNSAAIVKGRFNSAITLSSGGLDNYDIIDDRTAVIGGSQIALQSVSIINYAALRQSTFYLSINYDAGFEMNDRPEDLMFVVAQVARNMFVHNINVTGASELSQGAVTIKYQRTTGQNSNDFLNESLKAILDEYKSVVR